MNIRPALSISAVERETGLGKDTLRVWERRYGFPQPTRDNHGERVYPVEQVDRLRLLKRLIDHGYRPGRLFAASEEEFSSLCRACAAKSVVEPGGGDELVSHAIRLIKANDASVLRQALHLSLIHI